MKKGSLVQFNGPDFPMHIIRTVFNGDWIPKVGEIYTIREVRQNKYKEDIVLLEEGCSGHNPKTKLEMGFDVTCFTELPEIDLSEFNISKSDEKNS